MFRLKLASSLATATAAVLLLAAQAYAAENESRPSTAQWDDGGPIPDGLQLALREGDGDPLRAPGPPRDGDERRPPPRGTFERNREGDGRQPAPKTSEGLRQGDGRQPPPPRREGEDGGPMMRPRPGMDRPFGEEAVEKHDPEMFKLIKADRDLERQTHELAMQYRRAASAEREELKKKIEDTVNKHFEVRQERRNMELKRLESQLRRLREAVEKRAKARKELIDRRVSELIGREEEVRF